MLRGFIVSFWTGPPEQLRHNMTGCRGHTELQLTLRWRGGEKEAGMEGAGERREQMYGVSIHGGMVAFTVSCTRAELEC